jgi:penicillin-binding protein 1C
VRAEWTPSYAYLLDRDGEVVEANRVDFQGLRASWVRGDDVSPALRASVIAVEDRRFESHHGIDWRSILAAAWQSLTSPRRRGGSTITMQLAGLTVTGNATAGSRSLAQKTPADAHGLADRARLEQGPDSGGLPEPRDVSR